MLLVAVVTVIAISVPIGLSLVISQRQSLQTELNRASLIAGEVLRRSQDISSQVIQIVNLLKQVNAQEPCSGENIALMRSLAFQFDHVTDVVYVANNKLMCSSYGRFGTGIDVGKPDFANMIGFDVRKRVKMPFDHASTFRLTVDSNTGYGALVHPELATDVKLDGSDIDVGIIMLPTRKTLFQQGYFDPQWVDKLGSHSEFKWFDGRYVVAIKRSERYTYAAYAALPANYISENSRGLAFWLVPLGVVIGFLAAWLIFKLSKHKLSLLSLLKQAIRKNEFHLVYQPVIDLQTGKWVGAEALLRWKRPNGEVISPLVFIPLAERNNLIVKVTERVLEMALRDFPSLLRKDPDFHLAINMSADDLQKEGLAAALHQSLISAGIAERNLIIELTEREFTNTEATRQNLRELRGRGISVAIDDFGTGYSSLSYLNTLELDCLKIDKAFVDTIGTESATSDVVAHIISIARSLNLQMVAEGVETQEQADYLREKGVQLAQGWLFAKPMLIDELRRKMVSTTQVATETSVATTASSTASA